MADATKTAEQRVVEIPTGYTPGPWRAATGWNDYHDKVVAPASRFMDIAVLPSEYPAPPRRRWTPTPA